MGHVFVEIFLHFEATASIMVFIQLAIQAKHS